MHLRRDTLPTASCAGALVLVSLLLFWSPLQAQRVPYWAEIDTVRPPAFDTLQYADRPAAADALHVVDLERVHLHDPTMIVRATRDGGASWSTIYRPGAVTIWGIAHPTPDVMLLAGDSAYGDAAGGTIHYIGVVLRSTDGGTSWQKTVAAVNTRAMSIHMLDAQRGVIYLPTWIYNKGSVSEALMITDDGGVSWNVQFAPPGTTIYPMPYRISQHRYLTFSTLSAFVDAVLLISANDGRTWTQPGNAPRGGVALAIRDSSNLWCLATPRTGRGDLKRDQIWHSTDGGSTWRLSYDDYDESGIQLQAIAAADGRHVMATGGTKIIRTTDGGRTWERIPAPYRARFRRPDGGFSLASLVHPADTVAFLFGAPVKLAWTGATTIAPPRIIVPRQKDDQVTVPVEIRWNSVAGALAYDLQIGDTTAGTLAMDRVLYDDPVVSRSMLIDTSYVAELRPGRTYLCRVRARSELEMSDWSTDREFSTIDGGEVALYPLIVSPPSGTMYLPTTVEIRWDSLEGYDHYDLQLANSERFGQASKDTILLERDGITSASTVVSGLRQNTWYFARVRGVTGTSPGPWSHPVHDFKTAAPGARVVGEERARRPHFGLKPNPAYAMPSVELTLTLRTGGEVSIAIVDMLGREVRAFPSMRLLPGEHHLPVGIEALPPGCYLIAVRAGDDTQSQPLVIDGVR